MTRAVIFANGDVSDPQLTKSHLRPNDLLIAADGGLRHLVQLGLAPHVIVGDLDSAPNELVQLAEQRGAEVIRHPARKDKTDLELALDLARERGVEETIVVGAMGGRLDHTLANVLLLAQDSKHPVRLGDAGYELFVVHDRLTVSGDAGDVVTLLAITDEATGVTTQGLEYPLVDGVLSRGSSRGVSNVMLADSATISIRQGKLLAVHVSRKCL